MKVQLRDVHPAVWRRVRMVDRLSVADLHRVIQVLMGWTDEHLHRFRRWREPWNPGHQRTCTSMRWTPRGARLLLQTRTRVLDGDLNDLIRCRYPVFRMHTGAEAVPGL